MDIEILYPILLLATIIMVAREAIKGAVIVGYVSRGTSFTFEFAYWAHLTATCALVMACIVYGPDYF